MFEFLKKRKKQTVIKNEFECMREQLVIRGTEYRPQGEKLPIAIISHGFMGNQNDMKHYAKVLADLGYLAFCFDFNGGCLKNGKSDGKTTEMSVLTEVKDLEAVITYAKSLSYADESRILLMGGSQGGFVSALTAAKLNKEILKLILVFPALCIPDDARSGHMMFAKFDPENIPEIVNCGPMKLGKCYVEDVIQMNPYEEIKGYTGDVLIIHGTDDKIVKLEYSQKAYDTYKLHAENDKRKVHLGVIEGAGHGFSPKHDRIAVQMIKDFVSQEQ